MSEEMFDVFLRDGRRVPPEVAARELFICQEVLKDRQRELDELVKENAILRDIRGQLEKLGLMKKVPLENAPESLDVMNHTTQEGDGLPQPL